MKLDKYTKLFSEGKNSNSKIKGLCGRIIRGTKPEDFETLTDDPDRIIIMLIGGDGLKKLLGKTDYDRLITIGYAEDYIEYKVNGGFQFKLVVFKESETILLATWDNVAKLTSKIYPDIKKRIYSRLEELKSKKFSEIQEMASFSFEEVERKGKDDPNFMTYERFKNSSGTLVDVRAFLYHTLHLRFLYSGDGYTYDELGNKGLMEHIAPNKKLVDLGEHRLIPMNVKF